MLEKKYYNVGKRRRIGKKHIKLMFKYLAILGLIYLLQSSVVTFSRYYSSGSYAPPISVAKWDVSVDNTLSNHSLSLVCGGSEQSYTFSVESQSEVTAKYSVILTALPDDIEVSLDGGNYITPTNHSITYQDAGTFDIQENQTEHEHTLSFRAPLDASIPNINEINMEVRFSQVI